MRLPLVGELLQSRRPLLLLPRLQQPLDGAHAADAEAVSDCLDADTALLMLSHINYRDGAVLLEAFKAGKIDYRRENSARRWATGYDFPAVDKGLVKV